MGSILFFLSLFACHTLNNDADTVVPETNSGGVYGNLPGDDGDDGSDDNDGGGSTDGGTDSDGGGTSDGGTSDGGTDGGTTSDGGTSDGGTDGDGGSTSEEEIEIQIFLFPDAEWEASIADSLTNCPEVEMYETANLSRDGWDGYGETTFTSSGVCGETVFDVETITPGDLLVVGAVWWDGFSWRYFADNGNTVRSEWLEWDERGLIQAVVIVFPDGTFDVLKIDPTGVDASEAWYVDSADGAEVYVQTPSDTTGEYSL